MAKERYTHIILASASPRRKELLGQLFDNFSIYVSNFVEQSRYLRPCKKVVDIAKHKAELVPLKGDEIVISADTTVYMEGKYYDKPQNAQAARDMLFELSGKTHSVYSGVCIKTISQTLTFYDKSRVTFKVLDGEIIDKYITDNKPFDKAGAYGIQDEVLVKSYQGSYTNIMGLPLEKLKAELSKLGYLS